MRTLILAEQPFRDLRSRALLSAPEAGLGPPPLLLATDAPRAPRGFEAVPAEPDPAALHVGRVVIAGIFHRRAALERALRLAARALAAGARLEVRGLSVEREAARRDHPAGVEILDAAAPLEVREHHSANALLVWRVAAPIAIRAYPEAAIPPDPALLAGLPEGPLLGLAILGGGEVRRAAEAHAAALAGLLAPWRGLPILPLPCEAAGSPQDDLPGTAAFAAALLPGGPLLLPGLADPLWRRRQVSPARLKALAARCAAVVTNQDLPAALAVSAGVPVLGLALGQDRRIVSCLAALANALPAGSELVFPARLPAAAPPG